MQRNQTTTISQLQVGDRFYKCNDRSKTAYQLTTIKSNFLKSKYYCLEAVFIDNHTPLDRVLIISKQINGTTPVIFLHSKLASGFRASGNGPIATDNGLSGNEPKANIHTPNNVESQPEAHSPKP